MMVRTSALDAEFIHRFGIAGPLGEPAPASIERLTRTFELASRVMSDRA